MAARTRALLAGLLALLVLAGGLTWWWTAREEEDPAPAAAPSGIGLYTPQAEQVDGEHGSIIWSAPATVEVGPEGSRTLVVLYRSTGAKGEPVAVSGSITFPAGDPPAGGWPVLSWGHGTTGTADECAPSRSLMPGGGVEAAGLMDQYVAPFVEEGYVVARTDYEGLGTPGPHPYLMGDSAGRAMTDIVLAAQDLDERVGSAWLAIGHSQGGQAALFTAAVPGGYARGLDLTGVIALAPPSQLASTLDLARSGDVGGGSVFFGPLVASAAQVAGVPAQDVLSPKAEQLLPDLEDRCLGDLGAKDSFGGLATKDLFAEDLSASALSSVRTAVGAGDVTSVRPSVPVLLLHGSKDQTVPRLLSDNLATQYEAKGVDLTYEKVAGADHTSLLVSSLPRVEGWIGERLP